MNLVKSGKDPLDPSTNPLKSEGDPPDSLRLYLGVHKGMEWNEIE